MRKFLLMLSLLLVTVVSQAQTIHWLTFIDTKDENVGEVDVLGRKVLYGRYINLVNAALASKGYTAKIYDYYDTRLSPENCLSNLPFLSLTAHFPKPKSTSI